MYDIIIIGAGPAGISAGIYAISRGKSTLVIEKNHIGGLVSNVSSVTHYSSVANDETGASFGAKLKAQADFAGLNVVIEEVTGVTLKGEIKTVTTTNGTYSAKKIIIANGTTPRKLDIPGEAELAGNGIGLNAPRDSKRYQGKNIYVVGGADGAIKEALYLAQFAKELTIIHFEDDLGCIAEFKEKVGKTANISLCLHNRLVEVAGNGQVDVLTLQDEHTGNKQLIQDKGCGVFVYAGTLPNTALYTELSLENGFIPVNEKMETAIPGVYAAGDICTKQVRQVATAVSDGAIAAINAAM